MAASVTVTFSGPPEQRLKVNMMPMAKLATILEQACPKFKPALDPAHCQLILQEGRTKRVMDLQLPFRLANLPTTASAKLEVVKTEPQEQAPGSSGSSAAALALEKQQPRGTSPAAAVAVAAAPEGPAPSSDASPAPASSSDPLGLGREVVFITRQALESATQAAAAAMAACRAQADNMDVDPEASEAFFELTPEDFAAITRANEAKKKEDNMLKTRAIREAEERARAEAYGPVPVRVHFPDGVIMQAAYRATEPLSCLQELVSKVVGPALSKAGAFYLYTTPPKQVLRNLEESLFKANLVPAAHVYFHTSEGKDFSGPYLKPAAAELVLQHLPLDMALPGQEPLLPPADEKQQQEQGIVQAGTGHEGLGSGITAGQGVGAAGPQGEGLNGAAGAAAGPRYTASGSKVPKWMKLGGK
eukprot:CAMPEP_0202902588 /NCGR_PEP_ID=MMETSP1392-20130828/16940_1 /ASSEMBLY_ACC=CAM_ASM_000868 /TAXON_ID=225041 /ORGANISM="Chlamydomonas chlamydogama, Strain SAG 11-48b" /LENGTH=416 /DNA_ID=CAMNT_0049589375 /DNA_START=140 /DNA_END=1390 /DNA_ORIENTATION=-